MLGNDDAYNLHDDIARTVLSEYAGLQRSCKPIIRPNGTPEWTILAGIVLILPGNTPADADKRGTGRQYLRLVSLATGLKCLPTNRLPPCGDTLHDSHAEVLAKRGLQRFLLDEVIACAGAGSQSNELDTNHNGERCRLRQEVQGEGSGSGVTQKNDAGDRCRLRRNVQGEGSGSDVLEKNDNGDRYRLRQGVEVWMYISTLPCGDASTLFTAAHQPLAMAQLKSSSESERSISITDPPFSTSRGRNGYTQVSTLRTKPGRPDSFPSISMSCSDKIASWNVLGLQGGLLSRVLEPVYLDGLVLGGIGQAPVGRDVVGYRGDDWVAENLAEAERALFGRVASLEGHLPGPYRVNRPMIRTTNLPFEYDRFLRAALPRAAPGAVVQRSEPITQPTSTLYLPHRPIPLEILLQGCDRRIIWKPPGGAPLPSNRRSAVCKLEMLRAYLSTTISAGYESGAAAEAPHENADSARDPRGFEREATYYDIKRGSRTYQLVKEMMRGRAGLPTLLKGFEKCGPLRTTGPVEESEIMPPFAGWIVSGEKWECFGSSGTPTDADDT